MILIAKDRGSPTIRLAGASHSRDPDTNCENGIFVMEGMMILAQDEADRQRGYDAAMNARPYAVSPSIKDRTCWIAGYMEGTPQPRKEGKGRTD